MIQDASIRLAVAYGLIAILVLAATVVVVMLARNSPRRRMLRDRARDVEHNRRRQMASAAVRATEPAGEATSHQIAVRDKT